MRSDAARLDAAPHWPALSSTPDPQEPLKVAISAYQRRRVVQAATLRLAETAWLPLVAAGLVGGTTRYLTHPPVGALEGVLGGVVTGWLALSLWRSRHKPSATLAALALDRQAGLPDLTANAVAFLAIPPSERCPLMQSALREARAHVASLAPAAAAPWPKPRFAPLAAAAVAGGLLLLTPLLARPALHASARPNRPTSVSNAGFTISPDDLNLLEAQARSWQERAERAGLAGEGKALRKLVDSLRAGKLSREAAMRELARIAQALERSPNEAETETDNAVAELKKQLERSPKSATPALREAVTRAAAQRQASEQRRTSEQRRLRDEQDSLLKRKRAGDRSSNTQQALADNQRRLEQLTRQQQAPKQQAQSALDRALARAASEVASRAGLSQQALSEMSDALRQMAQKQQTDAQKQELLKRLEQLRETLRQQGRDGSQRQLQLARFGKQAQGKGQNGQGKQGQQGRGQSGQGQDGRGQGGPGQSGSGLEFSPRQSGNSIALGRGAPVPGGASPGDGAGEPSAGGLSAGEGHDPELAGERTSALPTGTDLSVNGQDTGTGAVSPEVISGAAAKGFVGPAYRNVYRSYFDVTEAALGEPSVPPGVRVQVRRYFELVRPRD